MKKIILLFVFVLFSHYNYAQDGVVTPKVKEFVSLQGIGNQLSQVRTSLITVVKEDVKNDFLKEFDKVVENTISKIEINVSNSFTEKELDSAIKGIKEQTEFSGLSKEKASLFQKEVDLITNELGVQINSLISKFGKPELFQ